MAAIDIDETIPAVSPVCVICGNDTFGTGPRGRLSFSGVPPRCKKCQSLERHRALRSVYENLRGPLGFETLRALQISQDRSIVPSWFTHHEVSIYGGANSIDIQAIDRADGSYDLIVCNHVLEHVPDDKAALSELVRVLSADGILQLAVPGPFRIKATVDWGYPKESDHGHYRLYGPEGVPKLVSWLGEVALIVFNARDDVTGSPERMYFVSRSLKRIQQIAACLYPQSELILPVYE